MRVLSRGLAACRTVFAVGSVAAARHPLEHGRRAQQPRGRAARIGGHRPSDEPDISARASAARRLLGHRSGQRAHASGPQDDSYKLILVDLELPDGSGLELISHLATASLPMQGIIAVSGNDRDDWREAAREAAEQPAEGEATQN